MGNRDLLTVTRAFAAACLLTVIAACGGAAPRAGATTSITGAGLTLGAVTMQSSATVPSGNVISQNPAALASVASGSAVARVVSTGAGTSTPTLGGIVIGLANGQTVHILNGTDSVAPSANYAVTVGTPQLTGQTCAVQYGSGTAGSANITSVVVYCTTNVATATLTGPYTAVVDHLSQKADWLNSVSLDGVGGYTGSAIQNVNSVITSGPITPGTYAVVQSTGQIPVLTVNGTDIGATEFNANAVALLRNATGGA